MRTRLSRILAIGWLLFWLGVVVPGHQRGIIPLPGATPAALGDGASSHEAPCCALRHGQKPCPLQRSCAICDDFVATLSTPPPVIQLEPLAQRTERMAPAVAVVYRAIDPLQVSRGRAPPLG